MKNDIDLLLINSFAPRQRIASDAALENSLAIIRTYLEEKGYRISVMDEQRITCAEQGVPTWCVKLLHALISLQVKLYSKIKFLVTFLFIFSWPFQSFALFLRKKYMEHLITQIALEIQKKNIPMVGIKIWYGDAYTWSIQLAKKIKEISPDTIIVAGGPQAKVFGDHLLDVKHFDLIIMGPGEEILDQLLALRKSSSNGEHFLTKVRDKLSYTRLILSNNYNAKNDQIIKTFTIPRYNKEDLQNKLLFHTLVDGMGCTWNKCNFCSHTRQNKNYIPRDVAELKAEILEMSRQGISFFRFSSSETPLYHGRNIAHMLLDSKISVNYSMFARAGNVTQETYDIYRTMIKSGLRAVFIGGETGHDLINSVVMNKGVTKRNLIETIQCIKLASNDVGYPCKIGLSLIYPTPVISGVTLDDVFSENLSLINESLPDTVIINPPGVFPATTWFERSTEFGFEMSDTFTGDLMSYEYSIYKPVSTWKQLNYSLDGQDMRSLLSETSRLHKAVDSHIPTNISDEYLMMLTAIGLGSKIDLLEFKKHSLIDIMSGSSEYIGEIVNKINTYSQKQALSNCKIR